MFQLTKPSAESVKFLIGGFLIVTHFCHLFTLTDERLKVKFMASAYNKLFEIGVLVVVL